MKAYFILAVLAALFISAPAGAAGIGKVLKVKGDVTLAHQGAAAQPLKEGDAIEANDVVTSAEGARATLHFVDGTEFVIGGKGTVTIDKYVFDPANPETGTAEYSVLGAAFSYVGGLMDKAKEPVSIHLDLGTIGIRGTKLMRGMRDGTCLIFLEEGRIVVSTEAGEVTLGPGEGTTLYARDKAPDAAALWKQPKIDWLRGEIN